MRALPSAVRRFVLAVVAVTVVLGPSAATLWLSTPSGTDIQARVAALTRSYGVVLLDPDEIPSTLAKAVVATEDERFYTHHGIDSIGLARALLYDVSNRCLCQGGSTITKQQIRADYLSEITTGLGRRGVSAAACAYFQSSLQNLTLGQYALLAGVTQAPSLYDPTVDPEAAEQRRSEVLASMISERYITAEQALAANAEPVLVRGTPPSIACAVAA
jgi:membrane peptidoglycan carboxypeptidase